MKEVIISKLCQLIETTIETAYSVAILMLILMLVALVLAPYIHKWLLFISSPQKLKQRVFAYQSDKWRTLRNNLISGYPNQILLWCMERLREKYSRTIHVRDDLGGKRTNPKWTGGKSIWNYHRDQKMPFKLLPNIRSFKINLRTFDFLFQMFGIERKHKPDITLTPLSNRNRAMNRYVTYQFHRMSNHPKRWEIGRFLIRNSLSYRLMALRHVQPNWWRSMRLTDVYAILSRVKKLAKGDADQIDFKRVYIEKANGKLRPLGVPTIPWRIYLHQWQCITSWNLRNYFSKHQHGFLPQRGVLTAWKQVFEEVISKPYIYEFDLKGFFDNVDWILINRQLGGDRTPLWLRQFFQRINQSPLKYDKRLLNKEGKYPLPELNADRELLKAHEKEMIKTAVSLFGMGENWGVAGDPLMYVPSSHVGKMHPKISVDGLLHMGGSVEDMFGYVEGLTHTTTGDQWVYNPDPYPYTGMNHQEIVDRMDRGVPQGSPLSPILAILALEGTLMPLVTVQYADDGLKASDKPCAVTLPWHLKEKGLEIEPKKSGYVRYEGRWLKPLKFLGMEYNGITEKFSAQTRNGATLEFGGGAESIVKLEEALLNQSIKLEGTAEGTLNRSTLPLSKSLLKGSWQELIRSDFYGLFFSRMQCDSWNLSVVQDFTLNGKMENDSWLHRLKPVAQGGTEGEREVRWSRKRLLLKVCRWAKVWLRDHGLTKLDVFNASSYAIHDLSRRLRVKERSKRK